jgi:hypothetical protein
VPFSFLQSLGTPFVAHSGRKEQAGERLGDRRGAMGRALQHQAFEVSRPVRGGVLGEHPSSPGVADRDAPLLGERQRG